MSTLVLHPQPLRQSSTPPPQAPTLASPLTLDTAKLKSAPIPNKHLPYCSPGPAPASQIRTPVTPPASPPTKHLSIQTFSILHPAQPDTQVVDSPPVYAIDASTLAAAVDHIATQALPESKQVFPWLHGLHPENHIQLAFFIARRKTLRKTPKCVRGVTIVKVGGNLSRSRLKGALTPEELLSAGDESGPIFHEIDPRNGFSVRNFQIQTAKLATVSDIVVYADHEASESNVLDLAKSFSQAQINYRNKCDPSGLELPVFNTFVVSSHFSEFERYYPELVALDSEGRTTGAVMDFFQSERHEMCTMSKASEIARNVWLGPTPDSGLCLSTAAQNEPFFDILIETSDLAQVPHINSLNHIAEHSNSTQQHLEFPSSGSILPPTWSHQEVDGLMETCQWIYKLANPIMTPDPSEDGEQDSDGDIQMRILSPRPRTILIHCTDGYTESTLLALAYFMYAECVPAHEAWLRLHCEKQRNFFAYPSDVALLTTIQPRILQESPRGRGSLLAATPDEPEWLSRIDGSLPSRILPYMYLGNLGHANNPELLKAMGIRRILSVGEPVSWTREELERWGGENLLFIDQVQDNGVDPLTNEFERSLEFIGNGKSQGIATLVHCRVGVSRSATICIAEVMASMGMSFPRAYCFVRARRLNVIIQPHLRFAYELLKWEEVQLQKRGLQLRRELEWPAIAREIAAMNKPYSR